MTVRSNLPFLPGSFNLVQRVADMDMVANTFMRAPGESIGTFALETAIDELAEKIGMDPIELGIRNEPEKDPTSGRPFSSRHLIEAYRAEADQFGSANRQTPGTRREGEWLIGMGCATATYPYYRMPGGAARISLVFVAKRLDSAIATQVSSINWPQIGRPCWH